MYDVEKLLEKPEMEYRPRNYWGWLENITPEETRWQVSEMAKAGLGGYVMHARGGLTMPYAGKQWMDSVCAMIDEGRKYGMVTIVDDEHGWPSGFGAGKVNGKGEKYQLKYLKCEMVSKDAKEREHTLGVWERENGQLLRVYTEIDPYYVDNMDPDVVDAFIEASYEDYNRQVGSEFGYGGVYGVFSDEPQTARYETPWSDIIPELFEKEYGYLLLPELYKVFENVPGSEKLRLDLYGLMARCFTENYAGRLYRWCEAHGLKFMGHTCLEDDFAGQIRCALSTMPFYENMSVPGIDWLCRVRLNNMTILQLTSVAAQMGKKRVLSEMFGCAGWSVTPEEMKWIAQWQHSLGINDQLQHLGLYSLRGSRKREYPASIFYQQPWFQKMQPYNEYFARISKLIAESRQKTTVLVLHPMRTAWACYDGTYESLEKMTEQFHGLLDELLGNGICPHLGDETLMKRHGRIVNGELEIGQCRYKTVVLPDLMTIDDSTYQLLKAFSEAGGMIYAMGRLPEMINGKVVNMELPCKKLSTVAELAAELVLPVRIQGGNGLTYLVRWDWRGKEFYYLVNNDLQKESDFTLLFKEDCSLYHYDPMKNTLSKEAFAADNIHLEGGEALILFKGKKAAVQKKEVPAYSQQICLDSKWKIDKVTENALTLDSCQLSFDGIQYGEEQYILDIQKALLKGGVDRDVWMKFSFVSEFDTGLYLLVENPEKCQITVNGKTVTQTEGWRVDKCLEAMPIMVRTGCNEIVIARRFANDDRVYYVKNHEIHEAEANRVTVNTELESIYLWGDFAVKGTVVHENGPRRTIATGHNFVIMPMPGEVDIEKLEREGLLFFAGEVTLKQNFTAPTDGTAVVKFARPDTGLTEIAVNGEKNCFFWAPYETEVPVKTGENEIFVTLTNSCRNLFGPHYSKEGDPYGVGPHSFDREVDDMQFVRFGIEGGIEIYMK